MDLLERLKVSDDMDGRDAADMIEHLRAAHDALRREIERLRAVMADALRIMELVPSAAQDHRPIEDVRKEMRTLLASRAEQSVDGKA